MTETRCSTTKGRNSQRTARWIVFGFVALFPVSTWVALNLSNADFAAYVLDGAHWLPPDTQELRDFDRFSKFSARQNQRSFRISWPGLHADDERGQQLADALTQSDSNGSVESGPFFEDVKTFGQLVTQLQEADASISVTDARRQLKNLVIGSDNQTTCLVATLTPETIRRPSKALQQVRSVAASIPDLDDKQIRMFGPSNYVATVNSIVEKLTLIYSPTLIIVCVITAWCCLRDGRLMFALFLHAIVSTSWGLMAVYFLGAQMDPMLILLPALWFVLSLSAGVHFINYFRSNLAMVDHQLAIRKAIQSAARPCSLATITTCVGLVSLCTSSILPIWRFGFYGAVGLLAGLFVLFTFLPALLNVLYFQSRLPYRTDHGESKWNWVTAQIVRWRIPLVILLFASTVVCAVGMTRLKISNKLSIQFPPSAKISLDAAWFENHIGPSIPIEVMVRFSKDDPIRLYDRLLLIDSIEKSVKRIKGHCRVLSATTLVPGMPRGRGMRQTARRSVIEARFRNKQQMLTNAGFVFHDGGEEIWRIAVLVNNSDQVSIGHYLKMIREKVNHTLATRQSQNDATFQDDRIAVTFTGAGSLMTAINERLSGALGKSCVASIFVIALLVIIALRSAVLGLVAMIPNLFPMIVTLGLAGWYFPRMDVGSIMTASIAIGISVDDTVHFMVWFHDSQREGGSVVAAVQRAFQKCGAAIIHTSLICGFGMFVFAFCDFLPVSRFGSLMFAMLGVAVVGDLVFLPALLLSLPNRLFGHSRNKNRPAPSPANYQNIDNQ